MTITDILVIEHRVFASVFAQIERVVARATSLAEVRTLAGIAEGLLTDHGGTETELAYLAYDHVMLERGCLERLHQEHEEIDSSLRQVQSARDTRHACGLLQTALRAARDHMQFEEQHVFPLLEQALEPETLTELAATWASRMAARSPAN